ncbi:MAG: ubiquinone/menaquinone biosynthesis methyltransferase [Candidatus Limnocylindria bacterium]
MSTPAPAERASGNAVVPDEVRSMFDRIAPIYDVMNRLMTAGLDDRWRRDAVNVCELHPGESVIDVACGSGALSRPLSRAVGVRGTVVGVDTSSGMLRVAQGRKSVPGGARIDYVRADALALPFDDGSFDASVIAFGLRNVADYAGCLAEMGRVTREGGRIVVLEIALPERGVRAAVARTWFERIVPRVGRLAGGGSDYVYLPRSVRGYPDPHEIAKIMRHVGLGDVGWRRLSSGMVTLHRGSSP